MTDAAWFAIALVLLLACLALGFRRWGGRDLGPSGAGAVAKFVLISTTVGGLLGAPFWWLDLPPSFAWDLPPVASRMLAAAALAFGLAGLIVLERPSEARTRLYLIADRRLPRAAGAGRRCCCTSTASISPRRSPTASSRVVIVLSVGSLMALARPSGARRLPHCRGPPVRLWLHVAGIVLAVWGIALFARADDGLSARLQLGEGPAVVAPDRRDAVHDCGCVPVVAP